MTTGLQQEFNASEKTAAAEALLKELGCTFRRQADGSLFVTGAINLSNKKLTTLPDLSMVDVGGEFFCDGNSLSDLTGAPRSVQGGFDCSGCGLTSLKGAPALCMDFMCHNNDLVSLEGCPPSVNNFYCDGNKLDSLEHAPESFNELVSDFGRFGAWSEVPEKLRFSPATRARMIAEAVHVCTVLDRNLTVGKPLSFRR